MKRSVLEYLNANIIVLFLLEHAGESSAYSYSYELLGPCVVNNSNEKDNALPGYFSNSVKEEPTFTVMV